MENCIDLSIGQPHFAVPGALVSAAQNAIAEGHNRYTSTGGIPELKDYLALGQKVTFVFNNRAYRISTQED